MSKYRRGLEMVKDELEEVSRARAGAQRERDEAQAGLDTKQAALDALNQAETDLLKDKQKLEKA